ncbi:uncharacterized protein L969DRAFT_337322 [Mixia osmundae IAM 14324]|uniref:Uncharacterized protein n=1 Tax=Mixia osmundae (strain CBS 9802 / IAM 14324 / JCM 22182 / KY 12970) TaxID=764103 RepID=G7E662_MIXOS|nr:uncharacterized protein L969DRAFT_337322 [Mixia osmundae IAM 14324]KEI40524.1 hypothetical protein L969DRAFT_337322 [Mixia osmundae IAM 14324]GAA98322.1 hypothetical protein E5Q_05007 [Mixia osmundae IAM 14324]
MRNVLLLLSWPLFALGRPNETKLVYSYLLESSSSVCTYKMGEVERTLFLETPFIEARTYLRITSKLSYTTIIEPAYLIKKAETFVKDAPADTDRATMIFEVVVPLQPANLNDLEKHCCEFSWLLRAEASILPGRKRIDARLQKPIIKCDKFTPTMCAGPASMTCVTRVGQLIWESKKSRVPGIDT